MNASNLINTAQISLNSFKTFITEQTSLHPITTIFLVVLPFLGIAALCLWGLRKVYHSYNSPTVEKIKSIDNPVIQQTPPPKSEGNGPAIKEQAKMEKATKVGSGIEQYSSSTVTTAKITTTVAVIFLGMYLNYYSRPTVIIDAISGYISNWRIASEMISDFSINLATQCTTAYSISQADYSNSQYLYAASFLLGYPRRVISYAQSKCFELINLPSYNSN